MADADIQAALAAVPPPKLKPAHVPDHKGGRPGIPVAVKLDAAVLLAQGKGLKETARETGISARAVKRIKKDARQFVEAIREVAQRKVLARVGTTVGALLDSAEDRECKWQAQAARVAGEWAGVIGNGGVSIHNGDINVGSIDGRSVTYVGVPTGEVRGELASLLDSLAGDRCKSSGQSSHGGNEESEGDPSESGPAT